MFEELMNLVGTSSKTRAVNEAVREYIRRERLRRFKSLRGKLEVATNEEIEAPQLERARRLGGEHR